MSYRHGAWDKASQRYADGCREDRAHDQEEPVSDLGDVLDGWDALANGATEGPWTYDLDDGGQFICDLATGFACVWVPDPNASLRNVPNDAAFIAAARTIVPQATAALRAVLALVEDSEGRGGPYHSLLHTDQIRRAITDALTKEV